MTEKQRLLERFDQARAEMRTALQGLDPAQAVYPGWDLQADIAHITGWEEATVKSLRAYLDGEQAYLLSPGSIDAHNDDMVRARAAMPYDEVLREWEATRETLLSALAELSERDLETYITYPWGPRGTLGDMLAIIAEHEAEHAIGLVNQFDE